MKILIAEDNALLRRSLRMVLERRGYDVCETSNGLDAWSALRGTDAASIAILDWMMPGLDGLEVCRMARAAKQPVYLIVLTARGSTSDIVQGLEAGADDYIKKPFDPADLLARLRVGERVIGLQKALADRVEELEKALLSVQQLQGLLPICAYCKKIRDDQNYWHQVEAYISHHSEAQFSHGICPECFAKHVEPQLDRMDRRREKRGRRQAHGAGEGTGVRQTDSVSE